MKKVFVYLSEPVRVLIFGRFGRKEKPNTMDATRQSFQADSFH